MPRRAGFAPSRAPREQFPRPSSFWLPPSDRLPRLSGRRRPVNAVHFPQVGIRLVESGNFLIVAARFTGISLSSVPFEVFKFVEGAQPVSIAFLLDLPRSQNRSQLD